MDQAQIFDRKAVLQHRKRAAADFGRYDFLYREVADRLADRLLDFSRPFPCALEIGSRQGILAGMLEGRGGVRELLEMNPCGTDAEQVGRKTGDCSIRTVVADDEVLPFGERQFDLIISNLALHWVNDLPGLLLQVNRCLRPDGFFLASMFGGETLKELRSALMDAEMEVEGGVSPRVSPFVDVRDAGGLLQRAGFALPVADFDTLSVTYASALELMKDLRGMGEANAVLARRKTLMRKETLFRAAELYHERFSDGEGRITASFDVVYLGGWRPDQTAQQQPLRPGSAVQKLTDLFMKEPDERD
ncbi:methyltransferase domain-containing protein [Kiloniella sp. b19]|uniref:methyltransferase domain-containing protein n=1 Tax=Kiloniella sp. GXU_MW_B19 TaxID=3141326 RepID=UPI0031CE84CD